MPILGVVEQHRSYRHKVNLPLCVYSFSNIIILKAVLNMSKLNFKKTILPIVLIGIFFVVIRKCSFHSLPKEQLQLFSFQKEESFIDDVYRLSLKNPVGCPIRLFLSSKDGEINELLKSFSPLILEEKADTVITIGGKGNLKDSIQIKLKLGNPKLTIRTKNIITLPFPKDRSYNLLQGNNSYPTHNHSVSRYAFDFTMNTGDTITSSQEGCVIGVIDGYTGWGNSDSWKPYSNQVIIYDTSSYLFTMYGHLKQYSSMVEVGDYVTMGQPIALSGQTGFASEEHLHFNVLRADSTKGNLISYRLDSIGPYKVNELKRNQLMRNK